MVIYLKQYILQQKTGNLFFKYFIKKNILLIINRTFGVNQELLSYVQDKVRTYFPYANWKNPVHSESCLYTWTRDAEFLIDSVPDHPNVIVGGGGSGHAFKHGAAFGETLADLSLTSTSKWESHSPFKFQYHTLSSSL